MWKIVQLVTEITNSDRKTASSTLKKSLSIVEESPSSTKTKSKIDDRKSSISTFDNKKTGKTCYFEVLELEVGNVSLSGNFLF